MQDTTFSDMRSALRPLNTPSHSEGLSTIRESSPSHQSSTPTSDVFSQASDGDEGPASTPASQPSTHPRKSLSTPRAVSEASRRSDAKPKAPHSTIAGPPLGLDGTELSKSAMGEDFWPLPASLGKIIPERPRTFQVDAPGALGILANDTSVALVTGSHAQILYAGSRGLHVGNTLGQPDNSVAERFRGGSWLNAAMAGHALIQVTSHSLAHYDALKASDSPIWRKTCAVEPRSIAVGKQFLAVQGGASGKVVLHRVENGEPAFSLALADRQHKSRLPMIFLGDDLLIGMPSGKVELFELPQDPDLKKQPPVKHQNNFETKLNGAVTALAVSPEGVVVAGSNKGALVIGAPQYQPARIHDNRVQAHRGAVTALAIGSGVVASGGRDGVVRIWHEPTGMHLDQAAGFSGPILGLTIKHGLLGVVAEGDPRVCFWPLSAEQ